MAEWKSLERARKLLNFHRGIFLGNLCNVCLTYILIKVSYEIYLWCLSACEMWFSGNANLLKVFCILSRAANLYVRQKGLPLRFANSAQEEHVLFQWITNSCLELQCAIHVLLVSHTSSVLSLHCSSSVQFSGNGNKKCLSNYIS